MQDIIELFNNEHPDFDGKRLYIDHIEMLNNHYNYKNIFNEKLLFHGTPLHYIDNIIANGFDVSKAGKSMSGHIGKGLYFSDLICQSIYYQLKEEYIGDETYFKLLVCKVSLGNSILLERTAKTVDIDLINGYDSHITPYDQNGKYGHEYCLFKSNQILPFALLHMTC